MRKVLLGISIFCLLLMSCNKTQLKLIHNDKTFDEMLSYANHYDKAFCIVLVDSTENMSQKYLLNMKKGNLLSSNAFYNIMDVNNSSNEWFMKWLCPLTLPLTCVFSTNGALIDLIPGSTKETFLYTQQAISCLGMTKFHYPNRFNMSKCEIVPLLSHLLKIKLELDQGIYESDELNTLIDSLNYPYPCYLKVLGEMLEDDAEEVKQAAEALVELENPFTLEQYKNEFIVARKILDPNYNVNNEPNIRVDNAVISLSDCRQNECQSFAITIYNDGNKPLEISKIFKSCSCLEQIDDKDKFIIPSKDSIIVDFNFKSDRQGEVIRDIFITSNAINMPIFYVQVIANIL